MTPSPRRYTPPKPVQARLTSVNEIVRAWNALEAYQQAVVLPMLVLQLRGQDFTMLGVKIKSMQKEGGAPERIDELTSMLARWIDDLENTQPSPNA